MAFSFADHPVEVSGLDIKSAGGHLTPVSGDILGDASPFSFFLSNTEHNVAFAASPGSAIRIDGTLVTNIRYDGPAGDDLDLNASVVPFWVSVEFSDLMISIPEPPSFFPCLIALSASTTVRRPTRRRARTVAT